MINGINAAHRSLPSLFFDNVRNESGCARDYEISVERRGLIGQCAGHAYIVISTGAAAESVEVSGSA